jgi:hypothetical protein
MRDYIVRAAFHDTILNFEHRDPNTYVVDELGLNNGSVRADIAVLNGKFVGYEIKADKDNLLRLASQVAAYSEIFEKAFIITGNKHLDKVLKMIPEWWGIYLVEPGLDKMYEFSNIRSAELNTQRNAVSIARLLWKSELLAIFELELNRKVGLHWSKERLNQLLAEVLDIDTLGKIALRILKNRKGWKTDQKQLL